MKSIFFHIPKTGGTSINNMILDNDGLKYSENDIKNSTFLENSDIEHYSFGHHNVKMLADNGYISENLFNNAFKYAIVRNPWDRIVSLYNYDALRLYERLSFDELCHKLYFIVNHMTKEPGLFNVIGLSQLQPQHKWIYDGDKCLVDYIGRFEDIENSVNHIKSKTGMKGKLKHDNKSNHSHYREYYNDTTEELVRKIYKDDIHLFGYEF